MIEALVAVGDLEHREHLGERVAMDVRVLADVQRHEMKAKDLHLPDHVVQIAVLPL